MRDSKTKGRSGKLQKRSGKTKMKRVRERGAKTESVLESPFHLDVYKTSLITYSLVCSLDRNISSVSYLAVVSRDAKNKSPMQRRKIIRVTPSLTAKSYH